MGHIRFQFFYFQVPVDDRSRMHMFKAEYDFSRVKFYFFFRENTMLRQVIMQITTLKK